MNLDKLAAQWEGNARQWEAQAKRINRSKCNDGERSLRKGMAVVARQCAEQLRELAAQTEPPVLPDASGGYQPVSDGRPSMPPPRAP